MLACDPSKQSKRTQITEPNKIQLPTSTNESLDQKPTDENILGSIDAVPDSQAVQNKNSINCEFKIRQQMENKSIKLVATHQIGTQILTANNLISEATTATYRIRQKKQIQSLLLNYRGVTSSEISVNYDLSKNTEGADTQLNLNLSVENISNKASLKLDQNFQINQTCDLILTQTNLEKIDNLGDNNYLFSKEEFYAGGESKKFTENFTVPLGLKLTNLSKEISNIDEVITNSSKYVSYYFKNGLVSTFVKKQDTQLIREFGLNLILDSHSIDFKIKDKIIFSFIVGEDKSNNISIWETNGVKSWTLTKNIWKNLKLGTFDESHQAIKSELSSKYLDMHSSIQFFSNKELSYPHINAYWKINSTGFDKIENLKVYNLSENEIPVYSDKAIPDDLISNETIQTELPRIQIIAKQIQSKTTTRKDKIQLILNFLKDEYFYDQDMVQNNVVRPLSTEEALNRGKGVCQHYAVIFTAIARALKIPTRIIHGISFSDNKAFRHAWNESEIEPNLWRVIEPQSPRSLSDLNTRFYIPLDRAYDLEDQNKKRDSLLLIQEILSEKYIIRESVL